MIRSGLRRELRPGWRLVVLVVLVAVVASGCGTTPVPTTMPTPPKLGAVQVLNIGDLGDPSVLATGGKYYIFGTDDAPWHIPSEVSTNLVDWQRLPDAVPTDPSWANPDPGDSCTWAPAAIQVGKTFRLYITVKDAASNRQCIAVMTSPWPVPRLSDYNRVGAGVVGWPGLRHGEAVWGVRRDGLDRVQPLQLHRRGLPERLYQLRHLVVGTREWQRDLRVR
ncbi:MAG: family 43 glycosylhydrolase [Acidimicrobiales bacterium]